ncbi:hypothetical protein [Limnofasciculus baicalensis]|uniref:Uncharacterized protein n=1 Tax=Limnofasciculus baicalensis BBK-W-15 TaxID=2699891 RepID=A0AAE3GYK4_9CYAN|nr:hypothetical protein [Limnofasciculus baicalensis]MCP2732218.1 hypothetical protein [Limnofasciculus baicalensis BBK-W-15]
MTYKEKLFPWCIIRNLPDQQQTIVARMRRRNDAEQHLVLLQRTIQDASLSVIFDQTTKSLNSLGNVAEEKEVGSKAVESAKETLAPL